MSEYRTLFDARGARYNLANRMYPAARAEEAERLLEHLELSPGERWIDVGAGGGFLAEHARSQGEGGAAFACDESLGFVSEAFGYASRAVAALDALPYAGSAFAAAGCLAALHHADDPGSVLGELLRVIQPGGRAAIGDVAAGAAAGRFLSGFVDAHTDTGHAGRFLGPEALARLFEGSGGRDVRAETPRIAWRFAAREDAPAFCRELFGLRPDTPDGELRAALDGLGLAPDRDGGWRLPWDMVFASAVR